MKDKVIGYMKRIGFDFILLVVGVGLLLSGIYIGASAPSQLLLFKAVTVSAGILHAHVAGKLLFPEVNWKDSLNTAGEYARIALYIVIPLAYTFGG